MNLHEGLRFKYLSQQEQFAYKMVLKAFSSMIESFDCSQMCRSVDLMKVIQTALGDNPSVIFFNKTQIQNEESMPGKRAILTGVYPKSQA